MPCHQYRFNPVWLRVQEWLREGAIGRWHLGELAVYRLMADPGREARGTPWRGTSAAGRGGVLVDHGTHLVYQLLDVAGLPAAVMAWTGRPRYPASATAEAWRRWSSTATRPRSAAAGSRSRTTCEPQAAGPAVRRRLRGFRLPGGAHRRGDAARRRRPHGLDVRPDPHPLRRGIRLQCGGVVAHHGRRAGAPAVLAHVRDHRRRLLPQLRHADGQRRRGAVQDRGAVALAGPASCGRVGRDLSDAAYAGDAAELPHGGHPRRVPAASAPGPARRPDRCRRGARRPVLAAADGTPPRRAAAGARSDPPDPAARPPRPATGVPADDARGHGRADYGLLSPATRSLLAGAPARVSQPLHLHARVRADRPRRGLAHHVSASLRHRWAHLADSERDLHRALRSRHQRGLPLPLLPAAASRPGARRLYGDREPAARPGLDRGGTRTRVVVGPPSGCGARDGAVTVFTHILATTLGVQAMELHGRDAALAYAFGVGVDVDHVVKAPFYLRAVGLRDKRGYYWRSSLQEPVALLWIVPLCIFFGSVVPLVFFAIHIAMDYSVLL